MSLNLTIDQGNTAAKIALWQDRELIDLAIYEHIDPQMVKDFVSAHTHKEIDAIIYCSVSSNGESLLSELTGLTPSISRFTLEMPLPIGIEYASRNTLGADRVAAAIGAWALYPGKSLLVVDAGTAVTYDHVTPDGYFAGGNIAPGMTMRLEALHRYTARLPRVSVPRDLSVYDHQFMGNSTESAMILGAVYGILGAITYYRSHLPEPTTVVITGGWARQLSTLCDFPMNVEPDLVSRGLNEILLFSQTLSEKGLKPLKPTF